MSSRHSFDYLVPKKFAFVLLSHLILSGGVPKKWSCIPLATIVQPSMTYCMEFHNPIITNLGHLTHLIIDSDVHDLDCVMHITFGFHVLYGSFSSTTERENSFSEIEIVSMSKMEGDWWLGVFIIEIGVWEQICGEIPNSMIYDKWSSEKTHIQSCILKSSYGISTEQQCLGCVDSVGSPLYWHIALHFNHIVWGYKLGLKALCTPNVSWSNSSFSGDMRMYNWHNNQRILPNSRWDGIRVIKIAPLKVKGSLIVDGWWDSRLI